MAAGDFDVVVVGSGNAALSAAVSAHEAGARVLVVEKAPYSHRGGNSRFSGGAVMRFVHGPMEELRPIMPHLSEEDWAVIDMPPYTPDDYYNDMMRVTRGLSDPELAALLANESYGTVRWMAGLGIKFEPHYEQALRIGGKFRWTPGRTHIHAIDGGAGLVEGWLGICQTQGIQLRFETRATKLLVDGRSAIEGVQVFGSAGFETIPCRAVVLGCGGFGASPQMRAAHLGPGWDVAKVRGTRYNTGDGLRMAMEIGAQTFGHWSSVHCSPIDANAAQVEGKYLQFEGRKGNTNRYSWALGIMINTQGQRFMDEGEDYHNYTYAKTGAVIMQQPQGIAYQVYDAKTIPMLYSYYEAQTPAEARTIAELAQQLDIDPEALTRTVAEYNAAVVEDRPFDYSRREGLHTEGIVPTKSNWAQKIDTPPYRAYAVTAGITFSFGGLRVDPRMQVYDVQERPIPGLFASGEMTGGFFYYNYPDGSGLPRGAVTGRIAGRSAAARATVG
ncbi:MAG: FAD-dependent tricarballylate dehydrogenase TcuA [Chloroflexi bacterium]|nr:FAD-dependent tricarballylate dehydrogenase TcuA [Chloroflexota bacterium]